MSLASLHPAELSTSLDRLTPRSPSAASLDESTMASEPVLTIEELRAQLNSCFTCGVSWTHEHVTLDCPECGGYALHRPCPLCQERCGELWERDRAVSHALSKACWVGRCLLSECPRTAQTFPQLPRASSPAPAPAPPLSASGGPLPPLCSAAARMAHDLCQRLEKLSSQDRPS